MANTYFLNAQNKQISIKLNSGPSHVVAALDAEEGNPCQLNLGATRAEDVLGTESLNEFVVTTTDQSESITWKIQMTGITVGQDIQFLVFANSVLARQGGKPDGFTIYR